MRNTLSLLRDESFTNCPSAKKPSGLSRVRQRFYDSFTVQLKPFRWFADK
jgi:hypothetical protein